MGEIAPCPMFSALDLNMANEDSKNFSVKEYQAELLAKWREIHE
jgi:hypothetical protein